MGKHTPAKRADVVQTHMTLTADEREALALALVRATTDEDGLYSDTIEHVKRMFYAGDLSAPEAADLLNLSLSEFVDEFIITDEWCESRGARGAASHRVMVDEVTNILQRERCGISIRDFVAELIETVPMLRAQAGFDAAIANMPNEPLGHLLRLEQASGTPLDAFVAASLLPEKLRANFACSDHDWALLAAEGVQMLAKREEYVWNALWFSALQPSAGSARRRLLPRLERALASKRMAVASKLIARIDTGHGLVSVTEPEAARLLWCYTRWIPYDGRYLARVEESLKLFSRVAEFALDPVDRARLAIVEGITLFYREQYEASRKCLAAGEDLVTSIGGCAELLVWCLYFNAKILWKEGQFDKALTQLHVAAEEGLGVITEAERATLDLFEAWLLFLLKEPSAKAVLKRADDVLRRTDCHLTRGDVLSARGRLAMADGDYVRAQRLFTRAINSSAHHDSMHRHVARARVNAATALIRHLKSRPIAGRHRVDLLQQALTQLDQAEAIYRSDELHGKGKLAKVFLVRASVYQAVGELVEACAQIEQALDIACALDNNVLMAEAKRLQAECSDDPTERIELARQADAYAKQTDDQRLHDRIEQSLRQAQTRQMSSADK